jgi:hypothetical protein
MQCLQKDREKRPAMAEIHDELRTVTHDRYHEAQEKLIAFVRLGSTQKSFQDVPGAAINAASQKHGIKSRSSPIFAAAVLTAVIVALVLFSRPLFTGKKSPVSPLPAFPAFNASAGVETPQGMQPSERTQKNISKNGPAPVTGTTLDMKVGILVLRGLAAQDTVVLNNKPVTAIKYDKETRIELLPGYYRLEIRRKNGPPVMRELELVPFERQLIDLGKEQR